MRNTLKILLVIIVLSNNLFALTDSLNVIPNSYKYVIAVGDTLKIIDNVKSTGNNWLEMTIPILVAIIGGLIAILQVRMNIIKSARINWIENVRDNISSFVSSTGNVEHTLDLIRSDIDSGTHPDKAFTKLSKELIDAFNESTKFATKVKLYLNVKENAHRDLERKIDDFIHISSNKFDKQDRNEAKKEIILITRDIISHSQGILKREWDRVSKSLFRRLWHRLARRESHN